MRRLLFGLLLVFGLCGLLVATVRADQLTDVTNELEALKKELNSKEANYQQLKQQLDDIRAKIVDLDAEIKTKEAEVQKGEATLVYQKNLLGERAKNYYKNVSKNSISLINLLVADNLSESLSNFFYQKSLVDEDKRTIIKIVLYIKKLEEIKVSLESEKVRLAVLKQDVDAQAVKLSGEIATTKSRVAELIAERDQLIASRLAALNLPQSAYTTSGGCSSDLTNGRDPGFSPRFGFFTFGVPHRVGMSQYGAWGRAKDEQNEETILRAYYNFDEFRNVDTNTNIKVNDSNGFNSGGIIWSGGLEEYIKRIYEIPCGWTNNNSAALKAQAIAVRSYVLASTNNGDMSICATQYCQVFKTDPKTDCNNSWINAVNDTAGKVMIKDGNPISAYFSSTAGGYTYASGGGLSARPWTKDTQDGKGGYGSFDDVRNNAYDKDSPWFYCDWGARSDYGGTAWLKSDEVADIANVVLLAKRDEGTIGNLYQPDKPNLAGKDTWDANRVKQELRNRGGSPFDSVDSVSVSADFGSGKTTSVTVSGGGRSESFAASDFKTYFNQRAPANIQIVGPLYNVEKR